MIPSFCPVLVKFSRLFYIPTIDTVIPKKSSENTITMVVKIITAPAHENSRALRVRERRPHMKAPKNVGTTNIKIAVKNIRPPLPNPKTAKMPQDKGITIAARKTAAIVAANFATNSPAVSGGTPSRSRFVAERAEIRRARAHAGERRYHMRNPATPATAIPIGNEMYEA